VNSFESRLTRHRRPVKTATQRLIVFIASPIANEVEELVQVRFAYSIYPLHTQSIFSCLFAYGFNAFATGGQKTEENAGQR
jgi:hypothetical protein